MISSVEEVASTGRDDWLVWGCIGGRPVLFAVDARAGAEMRGAVAAGERATAVVEPWQVVLEPID